MHPLLNIAIKAARRAEKVIVRAMDRLDSIKVNEKQRNDFVTNVDQASEQEIIKAIQAAYPDHAILAEESGGSKGNSDVEWIIDPLDGTANYIHGVPHFAISIAVKVKNNIECGLIYDPLQQELFTASKGSGAYLNSRRIRVSQCRDLERALLGTGFPFKQPQHFDAYIKTFSDIFPQTSGIRRGGSAALDLAYVASGRFDGFWEMSLSPWDMAAGVILIKEAGGMVGDFQGGDTYLDNGNIIAGTPKVYEALLATIQNSLQDI